MTKYYIIPVVESDILIPYKGESKISISKYVEKYYPRLARLENDRLSIIDEGDYCTLMTKEQVRQLQDNTDQKKKLANELGIPLHILAMNEGGETYEVATHSKIDSNNQDFLKFREQPRNVFLTYYNGDYIEKAQKFMKRKDLVVMQGGAQKVLKK